VRDVDGNEYVDCFNGAGTVLPGSSHPAITEAIKATLKNRVPASVAYENEIEYARIPKKPGPAWSDDPGGAGRGSGQGHAGAIERRN
jgi:glutamate-1-semialdehyde aminotransferase